MKKVVLVCLFLLGMNAITSCTPDNISEQEYEDFQAADKEDTGSIGNKDGEDEDEDHN